MIFGNPHALWLLLLVPALALFYVWAFKSKNRLIEQFVSATLRERLMSGVSIGRQRAKALLLIVAVGLLVLTILRPKYGFKWEEVERRGVDIIIALDVSRSMMAQDVSPNRLERAKREIFDLLEMTRGDRIGLVAFAGTSFLHCPLTLDYGAVKMFLDELDPAMIPVPGTAISEAIEKATDSFDPKDPKSRVVILITDGEDHMGNPLDAAKKAAQKGVKIYAIGIGKDGGAPIPDGEHGGFKKDSRGELIMTKLDEDTLQRVALETGGSYVHAVTGGLDLERIYQDIRKNVEDKELKSGMRKRYEERYQWPLVLVLILLFFEAVLSERRRDGRRLQGWRSFVKLMMVCTVAGGLMAHDSMAFEWKSKGQKGLDAYHKGDYAGALQNFLDAQIENPDDLNLRYNLASSYYKAGDYKNARTLFEDIAQRGDQKLAQKAYYNLGNTAYREGKLDEAVAFYEKALQMDSHDEDAKANLAFVRDEIKRRLEEMKKRQQNQNQQNGQNGKQDQNQQNGQQNQNGQNGKQDQNQQNGQPDQNGQTDKKSQQQGDNKDQQQGDNKDQQQSGTEQADNGAKQPEEQRAAEGQQHQAGEKDAAGAQEAAAAAGSKDDKAPMSEKEALQFLDAAKSDRKEMLRKRMQGGTKYQIEKDW
jgi:Ca-activated chloride channel family protein